LNNEARRQLIEIVKTYGIQILDEPKKVEGLLKDFCGDCKKEIFSIVNALKEGVAKDLANSTKGSTTKLVAGRLCKKLQDDLALSEEASIWSIESIAIALGIMSEKEATGVRKAQVEQKPAETGTTYRQDSRESEIKTSNGDELVYVEGGSFVMGDTWGDGDSDEKPTHRVELTYDFYVGKYPVTFEEYDRYCRESGATKPSYWGWGRGRRPVISVSWNEAITYCDWLSDVEGLARAYDNAGNLIDSRGNETIDPSKVKGYRLLTEAEWEYAARGGNKSMGYKYSGSNSLDSVAWYDSNSAHGKHKVGQKKANELGLYDMSGNVEEWCSDWYDSEYYSKSPTTNPYNSTADYLSDRVLRGGSWLNDAAGVRVAYRDFYSPTYTLVSLGFRICRTVF
jgi:formylglycine-generating enzyme required for sulfatase activity